MQARSANLSKYLDGKSALFDDQMRHDTYDDYWKARNLAPHMKNIHCAVLTVGDGSMPKICKVRSARSMRSIRTIPGFSTRW